MWLLRTSRPHCQCAHATSGSTGTHPRSCDSLVADFRLAALRSRRSIFCSEATEKEVLLGTDTASIVRPQRCRRSRRFTHACCDCCAHALMSTTPKTFGDKTLESAKKMMIPEPNLVAAPFAHVQTEFAYGSGVVELGLSGFLGSPHACYRHFEISVISPTHARGRA